MRVTKRMKKAVSSLLALSMVLSYVPMPAVAEEVCTHHVHDDKCGYVQAVEGKSCTHQCTESCPKKDVTVCVHDHASLGCAHTSAVEGVACDHIHGEGCGYVPAQAAVPCTCGAVAAHTAQCASLVTEGAECDCGMPTLHAEGCEPKAAVAEQCSHVHGACAYKAAVQESWGCGHVCTKDSGCVQSVCAHAHDASCGYVQAVKGSDCTFVCTECKAEEKTCTCESTDPGEHAPFCDLYVRTYEECKCVLDCTVEGLNDYCETCYFEGVEACGASGEEEASAYLTEGTDYTITNGKLVIHDGVTKIDDYAFYGKTITSVVIPTSVTTIGNYAFYYCSKLTAVTIAGNSSLTIGDYAFCYCSNLSSVTYQSTSAPASIGNNAFYGTNAKSVDVPSGFPTNYSFGGLSLNIVGGGPVAVASVTLKCNGNDAGSRVSMTCKASMQLTADISPANADNKKVTWTQAEQNGAKPFLTIDNDGTIKATFVGYTAADFEPFVYGYYSDVTVTTEDGSKTDTVTVEVNRYTLVIKDGETEKFRLPRPAGYALSGLIPAEYTTPSKPGYIFQGWKRAYEQADGTMGYGSLITSLPATMPHTSASNAAHEQIYVEQWKVDPDATFAVNVSNTTGGTVTANHSAAAAETVITLTVNVSNGYELEGFTDGTNAITTTKVDDTTYTFVMPNRDVTVTPVYKSLHQHQWAYSVNAAKDTITAACTAENCPNTDGGSVTISVPNGLDYTGNAIEAVVTDNLTPEHTVVYSGDGLVGGKPVNPGIYTAVITLGTAEISVTYTIENVLNGITITADSTGSVAVPTKDNSKIVTLTAMADYAYGADVNVTTDAVWALDDTYTGVSIQNNVITLTPEAAAGTIKATAAYGDKTDEITITLTKANAGVLTTLGEITGPDSISVTGKTEPQTGTYTITGEDAYGAAVTPDVKWSVAGHDDVTIAANGELTVPLNVPNGVKLTITATSGNLTKSKEINIIAHTHEWDFRLKENTTDTIEAFCKNTDGGHDGTNGGSVKISATGGEYNGTSYTAQTVVHEAWKGEDVTISYYKKNASDIYELVTEQKDAGSYKAAITVKNAAGEDVTAFVLFDVTPKALTIQEVTATDRVYAPDNTGVSVNVVLDGIVSTDNITVTATGTLADANAGADKTVSVTITLSGDDVNNYSCPATATTTVSIQPRSLNADGITATLSDNLIFEGTAIPALTVKDGNITLTKDTDYTVTQTGNEGLFTLTVEGKGNYKDAYSGTLTYLVVTMPDPDKVDPDDKDAIDAYDRYSKLNETYKDAELTEKLEKLQEALTAYDVIKGHKSSYTKGSGKTFTITANGYFGKFTGLKVDGKLLDSKYYTAKSGSTIVTLKNSYLDGLSDGKHTIEFLYTDGSTGGDHYFRISTNNGSPFTGDNNHIMMFSGIMMTSLLCMVMMVMFVPKKKGKFQR